MFRSPSWFGHHSVRLTPCGTLALAGRVPACHLSGFRDDVSIDPAAPRSDGRASQKRPQIDQTHILVVTSDDTRRSHRWPWSSVDRRPPQLGLGDQRAGADSPRQRSARPARAPGCRTSTRKASLSNSTRTVRASELPGEIQAKVAHPNETPGHSALRVRGCARRLESLYHGTNMNRRACASHDSMLGKCLLHSGPLGEGQARDEQNYCQCTEACGRRQIQSRAGRPDGQGSAVRALGLPGDQGGDG